LDGELARRTGEAAQGVFRLMKADDAPAVFDPLKATVRAGNAGDGVRFYPGSPTLIGQALRKGDRYVACELRDDDFALLARTLAPWPGATAVQADGFGIARREAGKGGRLFVLIDPPFERADDYERIAETLDGVLRLDPAACVAVWLPLKDLETFDAFLRRLEPAAPALLVAECRLKPLADPMKMNGCAMVIANPPAGVEPDLQAICGWVVKALGEAGGKAEVWSTGA
jgi:23S rRNA (adenine2030-N6)-methyltransferase